MCPRTWAEGTATVVERDDVVRGFDVTTLLVSLLGPTEVDVGAGPIPIAGAKLQALLTLLALAAPRPVSDDRLIDELWGDDQPSKPANALQAQVSQLRRLLGRDAVVRTGSGYVLTVDASGVDATRLEQLVQEGRSASRHGEHRTAAEHFVSAVGLIRGPPLVDVLDHRFAHEAGPRLDELVISAHEGLVDAELASGRHAEMLGPLTELVRAHPLWERFHAQLILALFRCGRQSDALRAYRQARTVLAEEVGLEPGPELQALERAVLAHDPSLAAPVSLASAGDHAALPTSLTSFVGRADELRALEEAMARAQLVTVVGPAGAGKTRLALEIGGRIADDREVRLVELAPILDPTTVDETVATAVGAPDRSATRQGDRPPAAADRAVERLGNRRVVVVLDNCEHVLDAAASIAARLLAGCPGLRIVATSREPLGLNGEHQIAVGSLTPDDAATLFVERARAANPVFAAAGSDVVELCRHLDGLPLAIELAAARSKTLPVPEITARLQDRFSLLVARRRSDSDRQRALRAAIDWSYDLLSAEEQLAFRQLSVFAGGFTSDAATVMCGADAFDIVTRLVDKSLVVADATGPTARFNMLESIRAYALDRLADTGERDSASRTHGRWCIGLAESAEAGIRTFDQLAWLDQLDAEHDNLAAALSWAATDDAEAGLRLVGALILPWWFRGRGRDARRWVETLLALATGPPEVLAKVLTWSGLLADFGGMRRAGGFEEELELADRRQLSAAAIGIERGDELVVAYARSQRSLTLTRRVLAGFAVDRAEIADLIDSAIASFDEHGDHFGAGQTRIMQAVGLFAAGDRVGCARAAQSARDHAEQCGDRFVSGRAEWIEGLLADAEGDVEGAYRHIERGLQYLDELGMGHEVTAQAGLLTKLAERRGESDLASQWRTFVAGRAGGVARHDVLLRASASNGEGTAARAVGDLQQALAAHRAALASYVEAGVLGGVAFTESCLGFLAAEMGEAHAAATHHTNALRAANRAGDGAGIALALEGVASGSTDGQPERAAMLLGAASRLWSDVAVERSHRADVETVADHVRRTIGDARFAASYERGTTLETAAAVDLAGTHSPTTGARSIDPLS
jgi:predicted ATPase/DNA-binding SARP family transcriptional activator